MIKDLKEAKLNDDYDFVDEYPNYHAWQTRDLENKGFKFELDNFSVENNQLIFKDKLGKNQELLYNTVFKLQPASVFEVGFGYANHLYSIEKLCPKAKIAGCELSTKQYLCAHYRYDLSRFELSCGDFLNFNTSNKYDFVYSNAVLMHMSTQKQKQAIEKMYDMSTNYVMILDGKLHIPDLENYMKKFNYVTFLYDFSTKYWSENNAPPIIISKNNSINIDELNI